MKIGIIVAMEKELVKLTSLLSSLTVGQVGNKTFYCGTIGQHEVCIQQCGIGKVNASIGCVEMIKFFSPDAVVSSGCAGGYGDDIHIEDVVVSSELVYHDVYCGKAIDDTTIYGQVQGLPARFKADPYLLSKSKELAKKTDVKIHHGLIVTGDWFVDTQEKMRHIVGLFPEACAIDMESAAIAQTCYIYNVPFISFRIVSDVPLSDEKASQYHDFWNHVAEQSFSITSSFIKIL